MWGTLWEYRYVIILLIVVICYLFEWQRAKKILYALMLQAKRMAKDLILENGKEQEDWVVEKAMLYLPMPVRIFINKNVIRATIHELYHSLNIYNDKEVKNN